MSNMSDSYSEKSLLLRAGEAIAKLIYRVRTFGVQNLPKGGCLLLPNHLTWVDAIILQIGCPRPIRFMVLESIYHQPLLRPLFKVLEAIPVSSTHAKEAIERASEQVRLGEIVCMFPEGELSRTGTLLKLRRGFELIARHSGAPVIPVWLDNLWGSIFSFYHGRYFSKLPKQLPYHVSVSFGEVIAHEDADIALVRERLLELGEHAYQQRPFLKGHLGRAAIKGLRQRQFAIAIIDGMDGSKMTRGTVLAASVALARHLRRTCLNKRIAVVLPPGRAAVIANLGVALAGKVPVNLNFTAGTAATEAAIRIANLEDVITAKPVEARLENFPWPKNLMRIENLLGNRKQDIVKWRVLVAVLPSWLISAILRVPRIGDRNEGVVLFTSGSSGEPKGVILSHRNILANVTQFGSILNFNQNDSVLASLPFFHSFGCTVTLWYPTILGIRSVTYPNPLDIQKNAQLIEEHKITLLLATPTFLRGYMKKAEPSQIAPLQLIVTGAEKLPEDLRVAFKEKFGKDVMQGYGLTETAPVVSVNLPDPPRRKPSDSVQQAHRPGSTGKLAPGIAARIKNPETGERLSLHESGMLWLRGPNIFEGYLNNPEKTREVMENEWFKTGDLGRFDEDGFLYIEGRISRFSKIGGEMVPHETLETRIIQVLGFDQQHDRVLAVVGIHDESKGEAIVLLSMAEVDLVDLRKKLLDAGTPSLWIPKKLRMVEEIPLLGSGKLDVKRCRELAEAE
jgi:acyl-[acyl-carrier-protein]-phospholipid O-acyltransferase/long-chain-fatty-acid--[acyl-carrier-protein] ligase